MKRSIPPIVLLAAVALAGCASGPQVLVQQVARQSYPATSLVEVLYSQPQRPYEVLARMRAQGVSGQSPAQLIAAIQGKAAALGAQAVIVHEKLTSQPPAVTYNPSGGEYATRPGQTIPEVSAVAIRFTGEGAP